MTIKKGLTNISKKDFTLAPSDVVLRGVPSQYGNLCSWSFSWDGDYNEILHNDGAIYIS